MEEILFIIPITIYFKQVIAEYRMEDVYKCNFYFVQNKCQFMKKLEKRGGVLTDNLFFNLAELDIQRN